MYELEDLDGTLNKNCIYTPSELRMKRNISSQCTRLLVTLMETEAQDGLKLSSKVWEIILSGFKAGESTPMDCIYRKTSQKKPMKSELWC